MKFPLLIIAICGVFISMVGCKRFNECKCQIFIGNEKISGTSLITKQRKSQAEDWCISFNTIEQIGSVRAITSCNLN